MKVFVTDANYKHTLGAVRSLGKRGISIIAGSSVKFAQSFYSKYCQERVLYPDPENEEEFVTFMLGFVKERGIDVLLPIGYFATVALSKHKEEFRTLTKLPVVDWSAMRVACQKDKTMAFAEDLGIPIPKTYQTPEEVENFPVVVKGRVGAGNVRYVNCAEELSRVRTNGAVLQEYVPGDGYGFYGLFNRGVPRAIFMHKRIREFPVTGGPSTAAESVYITKLKELGLRLLGALGWHGVAMVEFKRDRRDGEFKLMEINPKFWGSLDLSIAAGVDFPYLTAKMAADGDVPPVVDYKLGVRFRWLFPDDILHVLANPASAGTFFRDFCDKNTKGNFWWSDVKPNLFQIFLTLRAIASHLHHKNLRSPHGTPDVKAYRMSGKRRQKATAADLAQ